MTPTEPMSESQYVEALATLAVSFGANLQRGQILAISSEPGQEALGRAIAERAYELGALFVDLAVFDVHLKRARARHADPDTLRFVPPWIGDRTVALGEHRCARVTLSGPVAPWIMEDVDPQRLGLDSLPSTKEGMTVVNARTTNWTIVPCPTPGWATLVHPRLDPAAALERLWQQIAHVCRLDEQDPAAAWTARLDQLTETARRLDQAQLDALRFRGPGTDLTVGLLPSSHWCAGRFETVDGIVHAPNLPTEEVFTTPDPARVDGYLTATKPLFTAGTTITGLKVRFEGGRAIEIDAEQGADVVRGLTARDGGAARLGEVALVDREGRIGPLDTVFFDTLLDENAASHIAFGQGFEFAVSDRDQHARVNRSEIHVDFMIGSPDVRVTGIRRGGSEIPLLEHGRWRI